MGPGAELMKASVIVFPGSNCDRDAAVALEAVTGQSPAMVWHGDSVIPESDLIVLPGGFSYGDYLRSGAMAAHSPAMREVVARAHAGTPVLGICNGFQVLTEAGLLPGVLMRNATLKFICRDVLLRVERADSIYTHRYVRGEVVRFPIAHKDGSYFADDATLARLEGEGRVAFRYCDASGAITADANPNGSRNNIAGIYNETGTVLGLMPHPERLADMSLGGTDGAKLFLSLVETLH
jgi:phosphoribosylformylglycinamidine synthase